MVLGKMDIIWVKSKPWPEVSNQRLKQLERIPPVGGSASFLGGDSRSPLILWAKSPGPDYIWRLGMGMMIGEEKRCIG